MTNFALAAEKAVNGSLLLDNTAAINPALTPQMFSPAMGIVFKTTQELLRAGNPVDVVTLADALRQRQKLAEIGGLDVLVDLLESTPHSDHAEHYSQQILEAYARRQLREHLMHGLRRLSDPTTSAIEIQGEIQQRFDSAITGTPSNGFAHISDVFLELVDEDSQPMSTGLHDLDDALGGGVRPSQLVIAAACTSMGKTALAATMAVHAATNGVGIGFIACEQRRTEIAARMIAIVSGVSVKAVQADSDRYAAGMQQLAEHNIHLADNLHTIDSLLPAARQLIATKGVRILIVDYLQLVSGSKADNRAMEVASVSRALKQLANRMDITIIALSQLNRMANKDTEPRLSHLRESGAIEQDADCVLFIHRYEKNGHVQPEILVRKNRNGECRRFDVTWIPESMVFRSAPKLSQEQALAISDSF